MAASVQKKPGIRKDPSPRRIDRARDDGRILDSDPNKVYVWVYKVGDAIGTYEARGYDIETKRPGGVRSNIERKSVPDGSPVEWKGNVLMSCPKEIADDEYAAGQSDVDEMQARIISKDLSRQTLQGINVRGRDGAAVLGLQNLTRDTEVELENG